MLTALSIKNYALIDELHVKFNNGLSIITGETGAGKSILLGGLSLVLGKRADLSQIKDSSTKCVIEAVFNIENYDLKSVFSTEDLDYEPQTIIRREILPSGKSRAFINDTPVTLDTLTSLSSYLLDIHSQHQTLQLVDDSYQFKVIDALADNYELLRSYEEKLKVYKTKTQKVKNLEAQLIEAKKEHEYNLFLLNELQDAKLKEDELALLEESYEQLNNVETISEVISFSKNVLTTENIGVVEQLREIKRQLSKLSNFGLAYKQIEERVASVSIELDDIIEELDALEDGLSSDPQELERVSSKLQIINNLLHKHSVLEVADLIAIKNELVLKVDASENLDSNIEALKVELKTQEKELHDLASKISTNRIKTVPKFKSNLEAILSELGMPNARFNIEFSNTNSFKFNGTDDLQFLFMANKGGQFTELKKSVSGGELSRIMLAIKSILADYIKLPTLMFDEIDTGVSGEISNKMGDIMKSMSKNMQVFSITHLPQIAAKGHWHYKVYKEDVNEATQTQMKLLAQDERIVELAQMLGGSNITESAIAHAKQLLN
jgi:DNA repair protein RecN (Recombination protein N)